jgi:signal transduction histidine kinase/DNA-binding response OmpR family regulator
MASKSTTQEYEGVMARLRKELEEYRSAVAELQLLNDIAVTAGASSDVDQTLHQIVQRTLKSLHAEQGSIHLLTGLEERPLQTLVRQDDRSRLKHHYDLNTAITGWVLTHQEPLIIMDIATDGRFQFSEEERREVRTALCTPIWFEGNIIGLLTMLNKRDGTAFSTNDLTLMSIVSVQAGQLIKNTQLREENVRRMQEAEIARWENEKLQELDRLKSELFTGITHELRTPLALIMGRLEQLMSGAVSGEPGHQYALIHQQAARLLRRVNDLLALATIDAGVMNLVIARCDVAKLAKRITDSFAGAAGDKDISLQFNGEPVDADVHCDSEKIETILINLIANAVKYTPVGGRILVTVAPATIPADTTAAVEFRVEDTGIGFSPEEQAVVFQRFRRSPESRLAESTGIGLALVKELVDLHFGTITLTSIAHRGSLFTVRIPVSRVFYEGKSVLVRGEEYSEKVIPALAGNAGTPSPESPDGMGEQILIVEDDLELRRFMREILSDHYTVLEARDGDEGLARAFEHMPDLLVSDVLMPGLDGLTLCRRLKKDERSSHIPVVLLTSRAELDSRVQGLETGADDYIGKPFSPRELLTRIRNLLDQRRRLREIYRRQVVLEPKGIEITSADEAFLHRSMRVIEEHLADSDFSVEQFAREVGMSKTHLNRKLNALTDQSANEFIRSYRLKRAVKLLEARRGNVSEVAFEVGFNNPSYFAEAFRSLFGSSPSEYLKRNVSP